MRVTLLAGGTGGAKLAHGFAMMGDAVELTVIANVGDDTDAHGLRVCPDIDSLLYTLAGLIDTGRGWGVRDDTHTAHAMFERLGEPTWFTIGDADLATNVHRTNRLRSGEPLTDVTAGMAAALGVAARILPASDDDHRTLIETDEGTLTFQEYFVRRRQEPSVQGVRFEGAAAPTDAVLRAIGSADLLVVGPSNPLVSIGPILELGGVRDAIAESHAIRVGVSPIVGGRALKGPADRMLVSLGHEPTAAGVAGLYRGLIDRFVIDPVDAGTANEIGAGGVIVDVVPSVMRDDADRMALASAIARVIG